MPRIRSIKPEIISNEKVGKLTDTEFRLFIALIVSADDYGNRGANPKQLDAEVFWNREEPVDVPAMLARMSALDLILVYKVRGLAYLHLTGWADHQKVDHPGKPVFPKPDEADKQPDLFEYSQARSALASASRESLEPLANSSRLTGTGIRTGTRTETEPLGEPSRGEEPGDRPFDLGQAPKDAKEAADTTVAKIQARKAFTAYDLECLMRVIQVWRRTDLGMWAPGKWAAKSFDAFFQGRSEAERVALVPEVRVRAERFFQLRDERDLSIEKFFKRWNELAGPAARPRLVSVTEPDAMEEQIRKLREENRARAAAEKSGSRGAAS